MNSWMSRLLLACAPPLMMFIIGTGITGSRAPPPTEVPVQRQPRLAAAACATASDTRQHGVGAQPPLVLGAVELDHARVQEGLLARIEAHERRGEHGVHVLDRLEHALAAVAADIPVAQLDGFARAGGGAGGHRRAAHHAGFQHHVGLDGRIAARIQDLAAANIDDAAHRQGLLEGYLFHGPVELDQRLQQRLHARERPGVRAIGERLFGSRMGLHEQPGDAGRHGGARQHRHEFALAAAGRAVPAGQLHRMRGVEHHRAAGAAQDRQRAHVADQIVVAEREAALAHQDAAPLPVRARLVDHVPHLPGRQELALLDVDRACPARRRSG